MQIVTAEGQCAAANLCHPAAGDCPFCELTRKDSGGAISNRKCAGTASGAREIDLSGACKGADLLRANVEIKDGATVYSQSCRGREPIVGVPDAKRARHDMRRPLVRCRSCTSDRND